MKRIVFTGVFVALVSGAAWYGVATMRERQETLPDGIVWGNGRLEADQVHISAKLAGRVHAIDVAEGDRVSPGQLIAKMDVAELAAEFDRAQAEVALGHEELAEAQAVVLQRNSELRRAEQELTRASSLLKKGHISQAVFEDRETERDVAAATVRAAKAKVNTAMRRITAYEAGARRIHTRIEDSRLLSPVHGRVLYRLTEPGEVVAGGGTLITLLSLEEIYMEVFFIAADAARIAIGSEARIVLDVLPQYAIPAIVTFVSPEAQFTPKQVETLSEREKLVFRVRVKIPSQLVAKRIDHVKTGVRGIAYVKLSPSLAWPQSLNQRIPAELFE